MSEVNLRGVILLLVAVALGAALAIRERVSTPPAANGPAVVPATGPVTVALTGDTIVSRALTRGERDAGFEAVIDLVRGATVAVTNLEMPLLAAGAPDRVEAGPGSGWTSGTARDAAELAALGFDVAGQANNHAADHGPQGIAGTTALLTEAGVLPVGAGRDLEAARAPVVIGDGRRRIAILAVAISASPEAMATASRGIVQGRPGVNALRYAAEVTVDAETYETLRRSAPALQGGAGQAGNDGFTLLGASIRKGSETSVALVPDAADLEAILAQVARARETAEIVVVTVHSHEPRNGSDEPAELFRQFAQQAIDAGAQVVVGHGPHRVRGIERHGSGVVLYSVGTFLYWPEGQAPLSDAYDAGADMYSLAMGITGQAPVGDPGTEAETWWEGVVALASFDGTTLQSLRVHPVDLGWELPADRRGVPRKPSPQRAAAMLERLARLSAGYGTTVRIENGVGTVDIDQ